MNSAHTSKGIHLLREDSKHMGTISDGWHETSVRVRYKDTDRMGVVYYGNYLTFFEVGRAELMRALGYPYSRLEAEGYQLVVTEASLKYQGNVGYDALISIRARVGGLKKVRLRFDYEVYDQGGNLLVSGYTVHACLDSKQKPARIPGALKEVLHPSAG